MKKFPVVLDLETKYTYRDFSDPKKLGISVVAIFDYAKNKSNVFTEKEISKLFPILESSSYIVGFNIRSFDIPVLQGYYPGKVEVFHLFDIMDEVKNKIGHRLALNDILKATLNKKKTGHGLEAIDLYKEGKWEKLKEYCLSDTTLTKELFEYGVKNKEIFYLNEVGKVAIPVDWRKYLEDERPKDMPLTLPF